jgi:hypothetical protein
MPSMACPSVSVDVVGPNVAPSPSRGERGSTSVDEAELVGRWAGRTRRAESAGGYRGRGAVPGR